MLSTSYLNKTLKAQWWECGKRINTYVKNKMQDFDGVVALEVNRGLAPTFSHLHKNSIIASPSPHLPLDTQQQ
jgi:hypothetical protein